MEQLEDLKRKIDSAKDLQSVVKTMKSLAAVQIREYEKAVESLQDYNRTVELGLQAVMKYSDNPIITAGGVKRNGFGAVIFGSEQGMCGQFNKRIADYAVETMNSMEIPEEERRVLALGERVIAELEEIDQTVDERFPVFGAFVNITSVVQDILIKLEQWRLKEDIGRIVLFFNKPTTGSAFQSNMLFLLPLNLDMLKELKRKKWKSRALPNFRMKYEMLFFSLIREYFFVSIYRAVAESLASENASRLSAMQAAEKNIEERLDDLNDKYNRQRQNSITSELMDIVSGFEALTKE